MAVAPFALFQTGIGFTQPGMKKAANKAAFRKSPPEAPAVNRPSRATRSLLAEELASQCRQHAAAANA
jgi:hypothetical protein